MAVVVLVVVGRQTHLILNISTTVFGVKEVDDLASGRGDGGTSDFGRVVFADGVENVFQAVVGEGVDFLAALWIVVVEGLLGAEGFDELVRIVRWCFQDLQSDQV